MPVSEGGSTGEGSRTSSVVTYALGGVVGGLIGSVFVIAITLALKDGMELVGAQKTWVVIAVPLLGLALTSLLLEGIGRTRAPQERPPGAAPRPWRQRALEWISFPPGAVRADITGDVGDSAGHEERFPFRSSAPPTSSRSAAGTALRSPPSDSWRR
jgi:hypothetical protein